MKGVKEQQGSFKLSPQQDYKQENIVKGTPLSSFLQEGTKNIFFQYFCITGCRSRPITHVQNNRSFTHSSFPGMNNFLT
jgi:hypothetical protein